MRIGIDLSGCRPLPPLIPPVVSYSQNVFGSQKWNCANPSLTPTSRSLQGEPSARPQGVSIGKLDGWQWGQKSGGVINDRGCFYRKPEGNWAEGEGGRAASALSEGSMLFLRHKQIPFLLFHVKWQPLCLRFPWQCNSDYKHGQENPRVLLPS